MELYPYDPVQEAIQKTTTLSNPSPKATNNIFWWGLIVGAGIVGIVFWIAKPKNDKKKENNGPANLGETTK